MSAKEVFFLAYGWANTIVHHPCLMFALSVMDDVLFALVVLYS